MLSRMIVCASRDYLARHGEPLSPLDLEEGHKLIVVRDPSTGAPAPWKFSRAAEACVLGAGTRLIVDRADTVLAPLLAGAGIARLCAFLVEHHLKSGQLVELLEEWDDTRTAAYVHRPMVAIENERVDAFVRFIEGIALEHHAGVFALGNEDVGSLTPRQRRRATISTASF